MTTSPKTQSVESSTALELVAANHILFDQGIVDAFGHVSVRDPLRADRFLLSRNRAPALVEVDDLMRFDFDGNAEGDDRRPYLERFIHGEIYRARPDVMAVVHSHSPEVVPFTVVDVSFRPVCHMCGFIRGRTPVFEIRDHAGSASNLLICDSLLGSRMADCIGDSSLVLMRGHGVTVVGQTLRQAVFRSVYTELNARLQSQAMRLSSNVTYLTDEEADAAATTNDGQIDRAWDFWKQGIKR
jgi:HCOMODA/2-hydroxy-3-carboxy-muconic semialdehyde decarboxylase